MSAFEEGKRKENGLPKKREILDQAYADGYVKPENFDHNNPYVGKSYNPKTGEYVNTFDIIKSSVDTPQEYKEHYLDYDLQDLKKEQVRKNNKDGKFYNGYGEEQKNANNNIKVRKKVAEVFKKAGIPDPKETDRVMFAKDWDSYKVKRDNIKKPLESKLDNVINQRTPSETSFDNIDEIINKSREFRNNYLDQKINDALSIPLSPEVTPVEPVLPKEKPVGIAKLIDPPKELPKRPGGLSYLLGVSDD